MGAQVGDSSWEEKHKHRRVWVSFAIVLLALQAAVGIKFMQLSVRQENLADWEDEFDDLGIVCTVVEKMSLTNGYAYMFAVPGVTNLTAKTGNWTTEAEWLDSGYKKSKSISSTEDDPTPDKRVVGELSRCWRPTKKVHKTFSCGNNNDCYKIFDPKDDLKYSQNRWYLFRCIGLFFCGTALFGTTFLISFFGFVNYGFRPLPDEVDEKLAGMELAEGTDQQV